MCLCTFVFGGAFGYPARNLEGEERPFEVFTSLEALNEYRLAHSGDFFNLTQQEYDGYDDEFFKQNALVMFLTQGMSGSIRCIAEDVRLENNTLYVKVRELSPSMHTMDLKYNTLAVSVPRAMARDICAVCIESYRVDI